MERYEKITKTILEIESLFNVKEWEINNIHVWPLLRIEIYYYLTKNAYQANFQLEKNNNFKYYYSKIRTSIVNLFYQFPFLIRFIVNTIFESKKSYDFLYLGNQSSYTIINEDTFDKFYDPIRITLSQKGLNIFKLEIGRRKTNGNLPQNIIQPIVDFYGFLGIIKSTKSAKTNISSTEFDEFIAYCNNHELNFPAFDIKSLIRRTNKIISVSKYFTKIIRKYKIKAGIVICYYSDTAMAFNYSCYKNKITSIDIQHGNQNENHLAYGNWRSIPKSGFNLLPQFFWTWGPFEYNLIKKWASKTNYHNCILGGHIFIDYLKKYGGNFVEKKRVEKLKSKRNRPIVLLTLSWDTSKENHLKHCLFAMSKTYNEFNWWVRLHPLMINEKERILKLFRKYDIEIYEISEPTILPLPFLLESSNVHITYSSSTAIEAAKFGIPNVIFSDYGRLHLSKIIDPSLVRFANNSNEIINYLHYFCNKTNLKYVNIDASYKGYSFLINLAKQAV